MDCKAFIVQKLDGRGVEVVPFPALFREVFWTLGCVGGRAADYTEGLLFHSPWKQVVYVVVHLQPLIHNMCQMPCKCCKQQVLPPPVPSEPLFSPPLSLISSTESTIPTNIFLFIFFYDNDWHSDSLHSSNSSLHDKKECSTFQQLMAYCIGIMIHSKCPSLFQSSWANAREHGLHLVSLILSELQLTDILELWFMPFYHCLQSFNIFSSSYSILLDVLLMHFKYPKPW